MTPDEINIKHGKPSWKCWGCQAESGLHWWNGLSVAVCNRDECSKAFATFMKHEQDKTDAFEAYQREQGYL